MRAKRLKKLRNEPIRAFKYLESDVKELVLVGSIRLGSQEYFRRLSTKSTGDPNEGKSTHIINDTFTREDGDVRFHNHSPNVSALKVDSDGMAKLYDTPLITSINYLIFCATLEKKDDYWANKYHPPKDSVLFIHDFRELRVRIHSKLAEQFQILKADVCRVEYRNEERIAKTVFEGACPCRKRPDFELEKEIRAFFEIAGDVPEHFDVKINPRGIFEE